MLAGFIQGRPRNQVYSGCRLMYNQRRKTAQIQVSEAPLLSESWLDECETWVHFLFILRCRNYLINASKGIKSRSEATTFSRTCSGVFPPESQYGMPVRNTESQAQLGSAVIMIFAEDGFVYFKFLEVG